MQLQCTLYNILKCLWILECFTPEHSCKIVPDSWWVQIFFFDNDLCNDFIALFYADLPIELFDCLENPTNTRVEPHVLLADKMIQTSSPTLMCSHRPSNKKKLVSPFSLATIIGLKAKGALTIQCKWNICLIAFWIV